MQGSGMYEEVGQTSEVIGAGDHRRIQMLIEKCVADLQTALAAMSAGEILQKGRAISSAGHIVGYLRDCLRPEADPRGVARLDELYGHLERELFAANAGNDVGKLKSCLAIVLNIQAWWNRVES